MTRVDPLPRLSIGGTVPPAQSSVVGGTTIPATGPAAGLVALSGLTLAWGRSSAADEMTLPTLQVQLFDGTGEWATAPRREGHIVQLFAGGVHNPTAPAGQLDEWEMFRGRISRVVVKPHTAGGVDGQLVALTCTHALADLANIVPTTAWPAESFDARMSRIMAQEGGALVVSSYDLGGFGSLLTGPVPADRQKPLLDHVRDLYRSIGPRRMTLDAGVGVRPSFVGRRLVPGRGAVGLVRDPAGGDRYGLGAYAAPFAELGGPLGSSAFGVQGSQGLPVWLPGAELEDTGEGVTGDLSARLSRVQLGYLDPANGYNTATATGTTGADEYVSGVRTLQIGTVGTTPDPGLAEWLSWAQTEAMQPTPPTVVLDSGRGGGFGDYTTARQLLAATEILFPVYVDSWWATGAGIRPLLALIGGTIGYTGGHWRVTCRLLPYAVAGPQHAITFDDIDDGTPGNTLVWDDVDRPDGLHSSVTWADLEHVATGLGVPSTAIPPDQGWDR